MVVYMGVSYQKFHSNSLKKKLYCGIIPKTMDRDQFQILMRMLYFADNSYPSTSRLAKNLLFDGLVMHQSQLYCTEESKRFSSRINEGKVKKGEIKALENHGIKVF